MDLLKIANVPPVVVDFSATALDAIRAMVDNNVGAVVVATDGKIRGILAERDILRKVTYHNLPPDMTPVAEVMTKDVESVGEDATPAEALRVMVARQVRHLPIVDGEGNVMGILSILKLLENMAK
jgi:CBS domain-containing protein